MPGMSTLNGKVQEDEGSQENFREPSGRRKIKNVS